MRLGPKKIFLLIRWSQSTHRSLSLKGLVEKVYRAFKVSVGVFRHFSFVALYRRRGVRIGSPGGECATSVVSLEAAVAILKIYSVQSLS